MNRGNIAFRVSVFIFMTTMTFVSSYGSNMFVSINEKFGISIRQVASVCMDDVGFVWASSKVGILRMSEEDYRVYQLPLKSSDLVFVKLVYENNSLYAYTNNGQIFRYNSVLDQFEFLIHFGKVVGFQNLTLKNLVVDKQNRLWVASSEGLIKYENGELEKNQHQFGEVSHVVLEGEDQLLVVSDNRLMTLDIYKDENISVITEFDKELQVTDLFVDEKINAIWIGTQYDGLYKYDKATMKLSIVGDIPKQPILAMEVVSDSVLLVGVDGQGLWEVDRKDLLIYSIYKEDSDNPKSLRGNGVYDIYNDKNGRVWICTYSGGVSYFTQSSSIITHVRHQVNEINSLINDDVNDVLEDRFGNLWFATNNGISRWSVQRNHWDAFYHNMQMQAHVFLSLCEDSSGNIWAGTYSSGLYLIDKVTGEEIEHFQQDGSDGGFNNKFVFDILKDSRGNIWIVGVRGDLVCYEYENKRFVNYGDHSVSVIKELSPNEMLLGCPYGLSLLNIEQKSVEILVNGFLVQDFVIIGDDVWMGTVGEGLVVYNRISGNIIKYNMDSGLPSNFVNSIIHDNSFLWIGTENGICKFNLSNQSIETYPSINSLSNLSFNSNARALRSNGELVFGTDQGAIIFNPVNVNEAQTYGRIYVQDILVSGLSLREGVVKTLKSSIDSVNQLRLKHIHNTIALEIVPIGMSYGSRFSWTLEGSDTEWSHPSSNRNLNYINLPTGSYTLKIRMYDNSVSHIIDEKSIQIIKAPPFWETWWFLILVSTILVGAFLLSMKYYINLIKQLHSEEKIRFFANTAHEMRNSLSLIKAPIDELGRETNLSKRERYYIELAKGQIDRLVSVVTQLMDFQDADIGKEQLSLKEVDLVRFVSKRIAMFESMARSVNMKIEFQSNVEECLTLIDEVLMEGVVDNLISNAIKYSKPESMIDVQLSVEYKNWILNVRDYGIGISRSAQRQIFKRLFRGENAINSKVVGWGVGLLLVKKYVTLHRGKITCKSQMDEGTTFKVSVPILENNVHQEPTSISMLPIEDVEPEESVFKTSDLSVLIVEDNEDLRVFLDQSLQKEFKVTTASDGEEAWETIMTQLPDLIVSDVIMPKKDGFELCKLIKSTYETSHIPVVLLTALSEKTEQLHGLGLGADDYLTKPFDVALLRQRITTIISNRNSMRAKVLNLLKEDRQEPLLTNTLNDHFVKKALEVVHDNISNLSFSKEVFASEMNVSGSLLYKKIKSMTDQSPTDFVRLVRLNKATELLMTGAYNITEVSEMCGFASVGYFSTVFKKNYGKSPSELL